MNMLINRLLNEATAPIEKMGTGLLKQAYERSSRELRGARLLRLPIRARNTLTQRRRSGAYLKSESPLMYLLTCIGAAGLCLVLGASLSGLAAGEIVAYCLPLEF
jgi:hypothetical protein